jgi:hypothetical protein
MQPNMPPSKTLDSLARSIPALKEESADITLKKPEETDEVCDFAEAEPQVDVSGEPHSGGCFKCNKNHFIPRTQEVMAYALENVLKPLEKGRDGTDPLAVDLALEIDKEVDEKRPVVGKMIGVLMCLNADGEVVYLKGFSGVVNHKARFNGYSPPIKHMIFYNFKGQPLKFSECTQVKNPVGACAAPKMLQGAFEKGLVPIAMAEFWYQPGGKLHGQFIPSCETCLRNIGFLLCGAEERKKEIEAKVQDIGPYNKQRLKEKKADVSKDADQKRTNIESLKEIVAINQELKKCSEDEDREYEAAQKIKKTADREAKEGEITTKYTNKRDGIEKRKKEAILKERQRINQWEQEKRVELEHQFEDLMKRGEKWSS